MKSPSKREIINVTVKELIEDWIYRIDLDADYQREKIWPKSSQEELLDSVIKNIDIPKLYLAKLNEKDGFEYECIDGKQRMSALLGFYDPSTIEGAPLTVSIAGDRYTYKQLRKDLPAIAEKIDTFELTFVIYPATEDEVFIREIFRRLQLGIRLNSGERLKSDTGAMRDFIFQEIGKNGPFFRNSKISEKRFSREFALAQMCINSFSRADEGIFVKARFDDLEEFFKEQEKVANNDPHLVRIRKVLGLMDHKLKRSAAVISSRAVAVSVYLFCEELVATKKVTHLSDFDAFIVALLDALNTELGRLKIYEKPKNHVILEDFQKHISQASVEAPAIRRRHDFLKKAFSYFVASSTKGRILGAGAD